MSGGTNRNAARPMRVLVMVDHLLAGGAERVAVEVACALDRERFEPHVLVTRDTGPLESLLDDAGVPFTILRRTRRADLPAWRRAHRLLLDHDLLHAHKLGSNAWGALLARTTQRPLVAHEHNFAAEVTASRGLLERAWIGPVASRIICVSRSVADAELRMGVPEDLIEVIPNGVRTGSVLERAQARAELGLEAGATIVGIVGRLRPEKAHDVALTALARLVEQGRDVQLCVVGDGPLRSELEAVGRRLGIAGRVAWVGEQRDAARLASAFDIGLVCSHWEGMPLAALETMAAGVPLVATSVGALPELVAGGCGIAVDPGSSIDIARAIGELIDDPALAVAIARAGRERVAGEYGFDTMVRRIEQVYELVLTDRAPGRSAPGTEAAA